MANLEIHGISIILVGDFNPKIFQPAWFAGEGLLPKGEAEKADNVLIHSGLSTFTLQWLRLHVNTQKFTCATESEAHFEALRDLVKGTFTLLRHTPVRQIGMNLEQHYKFPAEGPWNDFGHRIAPKESWRKFMKDPGLVHMTMVDKEVVKSPHGLMRVDLASSERVKPGVYFMVNNHYDCDVKEQPGSSIAMSILESEFDRALQRSRDAVKQLLSV